MARSRRKLSAALRDLEVELNRILRIDAENQQKSSPGPGRPAAGRISQRQLFILTEGLFFAAFRAYEGFLRDAFLLYCLEKRPSTGKRVRSYLKPRSFSHAETLLRSAMPFLDWASPDTLLERAKVYLEDGFPVGPAIAPRLSALQDMKRLRNHIAHRSVESLRKYRTVLRRHYGFLPLDIPEPGRFLLEPEKGDPSTYKLLAYVECLREAAKDMT